jgi:small subunit ribosomal protein S2
MTENNLKIQLLKTYSNSNIHCGKTLKNINVKVSPYILYIKDNLNTYNISKISKFLNLAGNIVYKKAQAKSIFLVVGQDDIFEAILPENKLYDKIFYFSSKWVGGLLTNWVTNQKQIKLLTSLENSNDINKISKKEYTKKLKKIKKLTNFYTGIKNMPDLPDFVIFTEFNKDNLGIKECIKLGIPFISLINEYCNPDLIPYPIPANIESSISILFILNYLFNKISKGVKN